MFGMIKGVVNWLPDIGTIITPNSARYNCLFKYWNQNTLFRHFGGGDAWAMQTTSLRLKTVL